MRFLAAVLLVCLAASPAPAAEEPPDAAAIAARMHAALHPDRPSVRRLAMRMSGAGGGASDVSLGQARKRVGGRHRSVMVVLAPAGLQGTALMVEESPDANVQWLYVPAIGRVRQLVSPEAYTTFLNSDFTVADLGFVGMGASHTVRADERQGGVTRYELESIPRDRWYYARIVTWLAGDTFLPTERHYFDAANRRWKVQRWADVRTVGGVPTPGRITMEDVQADTRTEVTADAVRWDVDLPDALFVPDRLSAAAASPVWADMTGGR